MSLITRVGARVGGTLIGRRPGLNFIPGAGVGISGADNPANGRVDLTISATGAVAALAPDASLASSVSAGATTFAVSGAAPSGLFANRGACLTIDAGSDSAETVMVQSLSGSTFGIQSSAVGIRGPQTGFQFPHSAGAPIHWNRMNVVPAAFYNVVPGAAGTDSSMRIQRMLLDSYAKNFICWGGNFRTSEWYLLNQPVVGLNSVVMWNWSLGHKSTWTAGGGVGDLFTLPFCRNQSTFTASAATDVVTIAHTALAPSNGKAVTLNDPNTQGFPGGLTQGKTYYMGNASGQTCKLYTDAALTIPVNITADGAGMIYGNYTSTNKVYVDQIFIQWGVADVGGILICPEQPSYLHNMNLEMDFPASVQDYAIGLKIPSNTQYINCSNWEVNPTPNNLSFDLAGTGVIVQDKITCNAQGATAKISLNDSAFLGGFLVERAHHPAAFRMGECRNLSMGRDYLSAENSDPLFDCTGLNGSFTVEGGQCPDPGATIFRDPSSFGDITAGMISDSDYVTWGKIELPHDGGIQISRRRLAVIAGATAAKPTYDTYLGHTNGTAVTLHTCVGYSNLSYTFKPEPGVTGMTVAAATGQNIDGTVGPATFPVPPAGLTIKSTGGSWTVVV